MLSPKAFQMCCAVKPLAHEVTKQGKNQVDSTETQSICFRVEKSTIRVSNKEKSQYLLPVP